MLEALRDAYVAAWLALDCAPISDVEAERLSSFMTAVCESYTDFTGQRPGEDDEIMDRVLSTLDFS